MKEAELRLREKLNQDFALYDESHWVLVLERDGNVYAAYWQSLNRLENIGKSGFDIQITDGVCYILKFEIEESYRRKGHGTKLLRTIEDFCFTEFSVRRFQTTPSGIAKTTGFYEHRGYVSISEFEVAKDV